MAEESVDVFEQAHDEFSNMQDVQLETVSNLAQRQLALHDKITIAEGKLKKFKEELRSVQEDLLPAAMQEIGLSSVELRDGSKISIKPYYGASINKDNMETAYDWLNKNGFGDLIKNQVTASFSRGEETDAVTLADSLEGTGHRVSTKKWIEPMTLKAFVREQVEQGSELPHDLFNVFIGEKATILRKG